MLNPSWEDSWVMLRHSCEFSCSPCMSAHHASFVHSFVDLVGLQALRCVPDGKNTPRVKGV